MLEMSACVAAAFKSNHKRAHAGMFYIECATHTHTHSTTANPVIMQDLTCTAYFLMTSLVRG